MNSHLDQSRLNGTLIGKEYTLGGNALSGNIEKQKAVHRFKLMIEVTHMSEERWCNILVSRYQRVYHE